MKKYLGQHFLRTVPKEMLFPIDYVEKLQSLQKPTSIKIVEIGPGNGVLTEAILKQLHPFSKLHTHYEVIDIDMDAINATKQRINKMSLPQRFSFSFTHSDVLKVRLLKEKKEDYLYIFGSLPYNISKKIVNWLILQLSQIENPTIAVPSRLLLQKEVAQSYISNAPTSTFLGTMLNIYSNKRRITKNLPPGAFYPPPNVQSSILEVEWKESIDKSHSKNELLIKTIRLGFNAKRKKVRSVLMKKIKKEKLTPTLEHILHMRAHEISSNEWELIHEALIA